MHPIHLPLTPDWLYWAYPWVWLLALVAGLPVLWWLWRRPAYRAMVRFSDTRSLRAVGGSLQHRLHLLLPVLRLAAIALLIVAAARPMQPSESRRLVVEGIAIQLVIDTSGSMLQLDLSPPSRQMTRLDVVKDVITRFVKGDGKLPGRPNDLIGVIRFAMYADAVSPLTLDHAAVIDVLGKTEVELDRFGRVTEEANRTAIGDGLALAVERLRELKRTSGSGQQFVIKSRIVILLTDGENNAGMITPRQAGDLAAKYGIRVYTIAAGTGQRIGFGRLPLDDRDLRYIAQTTGGKHFLADSDEALADVYREIDKLERTRTEEQAFVEWGDLGRPFFVAAFALLALQMVLDATWLRRIP